jgi:hypothetical protein
MAAASVWLGFAPLQGVVEVYCQGQQQQQQQCVPLCGRSRLSLRRGATAVAEQQSSG